MTDPIIEIFHDEEEQSCAVRLRACSMPAEGYGIVLFDLARQVAKMFAQHGEHDEGVVLAAILKHFDIERSNPSSPVSVNRLNS